jgi:DNA-binding NarL/FixJ family response regulator
MRRIKIVIIEDNRLLREGLTAMLKEQRDLAVIASLSHGDALLRDRRLKPDVLLLDFILRGSTSLRLVQSIRATHPGAKIIIVDLAPIQPSLVDYVQAGVAGFVLKDATFREFLRTIRDVARGKKVLPPLLTSSLFSEIVAHATENPRRNPFASVRMTSREREVIELIAEGLSNKQIASRLTLAVDTVKSHVHNILEKLQLHTRLEIASYRNVRHRGGSQHLEDSSPDE